MASAPTFPDSWHQWAYGVLAGIGAPINQTNLDSLWKWSLKESGSDVMRWNNPLNTTQVAPGSTSQNKVGVQSYPDVSTGISATTQTLLNGKYPSIVSAFKQSLPTSQWAKSPSIVSQLGTWGSGANWLNWNNHAPVSVASSLQSKGGSSTSGTSSGNPIQDAINSALSPIGSAISGAEQSFVAAAINIILMAAGAGLMLAGLLLLAYGAIKVPDFVKSGASAVSNVTPAGRAVTAARSAAPKPAPKPVLSPQAQSAVAAAQAGRGSKLSPDVKAELRRAS